MPNTTVSMAEKSRRVSIPAAFGENFGPRKRTTNQSKKERHKNKTRFFFRRSEKKKKWEKSAHREIEVAGTPAGWR